MGPVMFVFDVSDTEPGPKAKELPPDVENPFDVRKGSADSQYIQTVENAKRDGIMIQLGKDGSQSAGSIRGVKEGELASQKFQKGVNEKREPVFVNVPTRYSMIINESLKPTARYVTMLHEIAHLYCGHLGTPNKKWWPDRSGLSIEAEEFEAESVAYLICRRLNIEAPSDSYLSGYMGKDDDVPLISLECVMKAAGLIEQMGQKRLAAR